MSRSSPQSIAEYQDFMRTVTGLSAVASFPQPDGRLEFAAAGVPREPADAVRLKAIANGSSILRIESRQIEVGR